MLQRIPGILFVLLYVFSTDGFSQIFTDITPIDLPGFRGPDVKWIDFDADGDLDLYLNGSNSSSFEPDVFIFENDNGALTRLDSTGLMATREGESAWGDLDNDGDLDAVRIGTNGENSFAFIALGNGDGTFVEQGFPNNDVFERGKADLQDFNNDGWLDILVSGRDKLALTECAIYKNNKGLSFTKISTAPIRGIYGSLNTGDFDLDGDIDILLAGTERSSNSDLDNAVSIFQNNENFEFVELTVDIEEDPFENISNWGDINSDGYLDIITVGRVPSDNFSLSVSLGGSSGFTTISETGLPRLSFNPTIDFIDFDSDGLLDVLASGTFEDEDGDNVRLFKNLGDNKFSEVEDTNFFNFDSPHYDFGDFDVDGVVDVVMVGYQAETFVLTTKIYRNESEVNSVPSAPAGLTHEVEDGTVTLSWDEALDSETASATLTYNVRIGSSSMGIDIVSPNSDIDTGTRFIPTSGNSGPLGSYTISQLANGSYFWSVQAIDNGLASSVFSDEGTFEITNPDNTPTAPSGLNLEFLISDKIRLTWNDLSSNETGFEIEKAIGENGAFVLFDTTPPNRSELTDDQVSNGEIYTYRIRSITESSASEYAPEMSITIPLQGYFSLVDTIVFTKEFQKTTGVSIIDYNNDGLQDVFIANMFEKSSLFKNMGDNNFIQIVGNPLVDLVAQTRSATWGDINNDDLPDVIITTSRENQLFLNDGNDSFCRIAETDLTDVFDSNGATWGDVNQDGYLDLFIASTGLAELYINNQDSNFTQVDTLSNSSTLSIDAIFVDINGDLSQDLFIPGYSNPNEVFFNDLSGGLIPQPDNILASSSSPTVGSSWADYDNDGDFDVLLTNNVNQRDEFYENDGFGNFSSVSNLITQSNVRGSSSAWLDFDNDGWEDIVIVTDNSKVLFRNLGNKEFERVEEYSMASTLFSQAVSVADLDNDGDVDIVVGNGDGSFGFRNEYFINNGNENNWISIKAIGQINNRSAVGAYIKVITEDLVQTRQVVTNSGNDAQSGFQYHFGVAGSQEVNVEIHWPGNGIQVLNGISANQKYELSEVELPQAPTLSFFDAKYNEVSIEWTDPSNGITGFIVERLDPGSGVFERIDSTDSGITTLVDNTVSGSTEYRYIVKAFNSNGTSFASNDIEVVTPIDPPEAPGSLELTVVSGSELLLTWTDESMTEDGFIIERSVTNNTDFVTRDSLEANIESYTDIDVVEGEIYFYRILAYNESGNSEYSEEVFDSPVTGLDLTNRLRIKPYPNPASKSFNILMENSLMGNGLVTVTELNGKQVVVDRFEKSRYSLNRSIDISNLKTGVYILQVVIQDTLFTYKLLVTDAGH